jgi:CheY-like chemotaxis protein
MSNSRLDTPLRVVVVDDSERIRDVVTELLERRAGCTVVGEASNGREALDLLTRVECDLVVMDLRMPVMDGLEATRAIRQRHPHITVVGFTSANDPVAAQAMLDAGADAHFDKARQHQELVAYVSAQARTGPP